MLNVLSGGVAADQWIADYHAYLERVVGAATTTCVRHLPIVRRFIARCFGSEAPDWTMLSVGQLAEFIRRSALHPRPGQLSQQLLVEADIELGYLELLIGKRLSPDSEGRHSGWRRTLATRRRRL